MKQVPDRRQLRREYLRKKGAAYTSATVLSLLFMPAILLAGLCGIGVFCAILAILGELFTGSDSFQGGTIDFCVSAMLGGFMVGGVAGIFAYFCYRGINQAHKAADIPYVPSATPATFPAGEILVRAVEELPIAQSGVLLRAAQRGQETPAEELLRVSQGEPS